MKQSFPDKRGNWFCAVSLTIDIFTLEKAKVTQIPNTLLVRASQVILSALKRFKNFFHLSPYLISKNQWRRLLLIIYYHVLFCIKKCFEHAIVSFVTCCWQSGGASMWTTHSHCGTSDTALWERMMMYDCVSPYISISRGGGTKPPQKLGGTL